MRCKNMPLNHIPILVTGEGEPEPKGNIAARGYISESDVADDERIQRSRMNQTRFNNDNQEKLY